MDKANSRILFLVLIAVMFIGQAVYDFVKKKRSQAQRFKAGPQLKPKPEQQSSRPPKPRHESASALTPLPHKKEEPQITEADSQPHSEQSDQRDEIRRAIIWSEILKRKF